MRQDNVDDGTIAGAHGKNDIQKSKFPQLPLSPLMDPDLQAARNRYEARKPAPSGEPSDFQKKLRRNPYGEICLQAIEWSCC